MKFNDVKDIQILQYENLRQCFRDNLINPILGNNYYNLSLDVYTCDKLTTEDLNYEYMRLKGRCKLYKFISLLLLILVVSIFILNKFKDFKEFTFIESYVLFEILVGVMAILVIFIYVVVNKFRTGSWF